MNHSAVKMRHIAGELLDVRQTAKLIGCSERAIRSRIVRNLIPYRRWGGRVVFLKEEILTYLQTLPGPSIEEVIANSR